jgi:signal transduction histidine kinase
MDLFQNYLLTDSGKNLFIDDISAISKGKIIDNSLVRFMTDNYQYPAIFCKSVKNGSIIIYEINPAACRLLNSERSVLLKANLISFLSSECSSVCRRFLKQTPQKGYNTIEATLIRKGGEKKEVELQNYLVNDGSGSLILVLLKDVTNFRRALNDLTTYRTFSEMIEAAGKTGYWIYDFHKKKFWASPGTRSVFSFEKPDVSADQVPQLRLAMQVKKIDELLLDHVFSGRLDCTDFEICSKSENFTAHYRSVSEFNFFDGKIYGIIEDVTEKKRLEENLSATRYYAESSNRRKKGYILNVSREIYTLMNRIAGYSRLLEQEDLPQNVRIDYMNFIIKSCNKLIRVVSDMLDISSVETAQMKLQNDRLVISDFLNEICMAYEMDAITKGIELRLHHDGLPSEFSVMSDEAKLRKVMFYIIENAINFSSYGYVEIGCNVREDHLEFFVRDTGTGMTSDQLQTINELFSQSAKSYSHQCGENAGLAISKWYLDFLGGTISAYSVPGEGSTFWFTIPTISGCPDPERVQSKDDIKA